MRNILEAIHHMPSNLNSHFRQQLGALTREAYLLAWSVQITRATDVNDVVSTLPQFIQELCTEPNKLKKDAVKMTHQQVQQARKSLPTALSKMLIIRLDAMFHGFLHTTYNRSADEDEESFEKALGELWPRHKRRSTTDWAYKDVILMAQTRNHFVHGGNVTRNGKRLLDAGWREDELAALDNLSTPTIDDFFRFKRAVRTVANEVLKAMSVDSPRGIAAQTDKPSLRTA